MEKKCIQELYYGNPGAKILIICSGLNELTKVHVVILPSERTVINNVTLVVFQLWSVHGTATFWCHSVIYEKRQLEHLVMVICRSIGNIG